MFDDDRAAREAIEIRAERLRRKLDNLEADLTRVVETLLQATGRGDLALDFLQHLGKPRPIVH